MAEKITAIYLMVRNEELKPEDHGSYDRPMAKQKEDCLQFLKEKAGGEITEPFEVYTRRGQLVIDVEREQIKRLVVHSLDRLGGTKEEVEAFLYELNVRGVEVLSVTE